MTLVSAIRRLVLSADRPELAVVYFRVGVTLVLLWQAAELAPDALSLFGRHGVVQWEIAEAVAPRLTPSVGQIATPFARMGISPDATLCIIFVSYVAALCALCIGTFAPISAVSAWFTHMMLTATGSLAAYGLQSFANIALFYIMVCSVATLTTVGESRRVRTALMLRTLQIHLCVVYFASGVEKASGTQWWNGEAIWRSVMQPQFSQFNMSPFAQIGALFVLGGWTTLLIEIGYPFAMWCPCTRRIWCGAAVALHLLIAACLGLWLFSGMMIVLTMTIFGSDMITASLARLHRVVRRVAAVALPR